MTAAGLWYQVTFRGRQGLGFLQVRLHHRQLGGSSTATRYVVGDTGKSNVHTGPGLSYKVIGVLRVDDSAKYLEKTSVDNRGVTWYKISWKGENAWVSSKYTRLSSKRAADYGNDHYEGPPWWPTATPMCARAPGLSYRSFDVMYEDDEADYLGKSSMDSRGVPGTRSTGTARPAGSPPSTPRCIDPLSLRRSPECLTADIRGLFLTSPNPLFLNTFTVY